MQIGYYWNLQSGYRIVSKAFKERVFMNKFAIRIIASALAVSMIMPLAACKKKAKNGSRSGTKITSDSPWYDTKVIDIDVELDPDRSIEYTYKRMAGADDDYMVILTTGNYRMPENLDWDEYNYKDYEIAKLTVFDRQTCETVNDIDLCSTMADSDYVEDASYADGTITAIFNTYDETTWEVVRKEVDYDVETGKITDTRELEDPDYSNIERTFTLGDYRVDTELHWEDLAWYSLYIYDKDGNKQTVELQGSNGEEYYDIPAIFLISESTALVPATSQKSDKYFFELDLTNGKMTKVDNKEYDWLDLDSIYSTFTGTDGNVYYTTATGISRLNFKEKNSEEVFNYSWCGISRNKISYLDIAQFNGDSFILSGEDYSSEAFSDQYSSEFTLIEFTKAAKNPHAGKTILELYASYGYTEGRVSDAILKFNETNGDYFIEVTDRYSNNGDNTLYDDVNSEDDYQTIQLGLDADMSNQLSMDILNGEGPDLLMNVSSYGQLNSTNYLVDLTKYVGDLDSEKYFTNVIDAAKVDGKLFNLPVCFSIEGIHTDAKYAGKSGVGFTTEEYKQFLNETLNGTDVITSGQAIYFTKLFDNMSDEFIVNGKADFSGSDFEALAEFVKDNVPENARSWDDMMYDDDYAEVSYAVGASIFKGDTYNSGVATYTYCHGFSSYFSEMTSLSGATAVLGIPSADGRGPTVSPYVSIAISSQACNVDACGEFVKMLLTEEVQMDLGMNDNFVLNRDAFRAVGEKAVEYYNGEGRYYMVTYDWSDDNPTENAIKLTEKNIDDLENIILSCSQMNSSDAAINLILIEEMPAYFSGQKELSDVITIAQDRAQKVLDERG